MSKRQEKRKQHEYVGTAAALMRQLMDATNLNASEVAREIGVAPSTVSRILRGGTCPSFDDMTHYAACLGFEIAGGDVRRPKRLRGYRSPKEIGDFVNSELEGGLDSEKLHVILRYIPKTILDWRDLSREDCILLMRQPARIKNKEYQALLEAAVQYFAHEELWCEAPDWTRRTRLGRPFVPRAAVREIGIQRYKRMQPNGLSEFLAKNILFTRSEMMVL
jgi:transcriptional regulator with XRE-family HTH domain